MTKNGGAQIFKVKKVAKALNTSKAICTGAPRYYAFFVQKIEYIINDLRCLNSTCVVVLKNICAKSAQNLTSLDTSRSYESTGLHISLRRRQ